MALASPTHFRSDHFDFKILRKEGLVLLLEKSKPQYHAGYEVMVLKPPGKPFIRAGMTISPTTDRMPKSHEWGKRAWTFVASQYEEADRKFDSLVKRQKNRA